MDGMVEAGGAMRLLRSNHVNISHSAFLRASLRAQVTAAAMAAIRVKCICIVACIYELLAGAMAALEASGVAPTKPSRFLPTVRLQLTAELLALAMEGFELLLAERRQQGLGGEDETLDRFRGRWNVPSNVPSTFPPTCPPGRPGWAEEGKL